MSQKDQNFPNTDFERASLVHSSRISNDFSSMGTSSYNFQSFKNSTQTEDFIKMTQKSKLKMESLESSSQSQKAKCFKFSSELSFKPKSMGSKLAEIFNQFEIPSPHYLISQIEELIKQESDSQSEVYMQEWMERIDE